MPPVVAAVAAYFAISAAMATVLIVSAVVMVATIAYSVYMMASMRTPGYGSSINGRTQVARTAIEPRRYVYGQVMLSGPMVFACSSGDKNKYIHMVITLTGHQVQEIGDIYLGDKLSTDPSYGLTTKEQGHWEYTYDVDGNIISETYVVDVPAGFRSLVTVRKYLGTADQQADAGLIAVSGGRWTSAHRLQGVAYIVVTLEYNTTCFPNGIPNLKAVVKGNNQIYDPRTGTTGYTTNWALCVRDYLTKPYGIACEPDEINEAQAIAAANVCDELITLASGGTEPRYAMNGMFAADDKPLEIMKTMLTGAAGTVVWSQGQYHIHPAAYNTPDPSHVITEDDLAGTVTVQPMKSARDKFNTVRGTFCNPADYWQEVDFPPVKNSIALAQDGRELAQDIQLPFTTSASMAQRIAKVHLEKELQGIVVQITGKPKMFKYKPQDVVLLSLASMGWDGKEFRITKWEMTDQGGVNLTLREESPACYDWNSGEETVIDPAPDTSLPDPWTVVPPSDLLLSEELVSVQGGIVARLVAQLIDNDNVFVSRYEVEARKRGDILWTSMGTTQITSLLGAEAGKVYDVRARSFNILGVSSDYITASRLVLGLSAPPPDLTGFRINCIGTEAHLSWTPVVDIGLSHYTIKYSPLTVGASWSSSVSLVPVVSGNSVTVPAMVGTYLIKAVRYGGSESTTASMVTSTIAGIAGLNAVELYEPFPAWDGTHSNTEVFDGVLRMNSNENMSGWTTLSSVMSLGYGVTGYSATGEYQSSTVIDLGQVFTSRLTAQLFATATNTLNVMAGWTRLSDVVALSGADPGEWDITLQVSYTSDDPALDNWSGWQEFVVGDYAARAFKFRLLLYSYRSYLLVQVAQLSVNIDMPDRVLSLQDVVCPAAGMRVTFDPPFRALKGLATDGQDMVTGDYKTITNKDESGFNIRFYNASAAGIERTFDVLATGYGTQEV